MDLLLASLESDVRLALIIIFFTWAFNWARANYGSAKLAAIIALFLVYLTLYKHPEIVWLLFFALIGVPFLSGFLGKVKPEKPKAEPLAPPIKIIWKEEK